MAKGFLDSLALTRCEKGGVEAFWLNGSISAKRSEATGRVQNGCLLTLMSKVGISCLVKTKTKAKPKIFYSLG